MSAILSDLPSTYYRVVVKALICNEAGNLLLAYNVHNEWEVPGGGWEYGEESLEECIRREVQEELGVEIASIGEVAFIIPAPNFEGIMTLRIAVPVTVVSQAFRPGDGLVAAGYLEADIDDPLVMEVSDLPIVLRYYGSAIDKNRDNR